MPGPLITKRAAARRQSWHGLTLPEIDAGEYQRSIARSIAHAKVQFMVAPADDTASLNQGIAVELRGTRLVTRDSALESGDADLTRDGSTWVRPAPPCAAPPPARRRLRWSAPPGSETRVLCARAKKCQRTRPIVTHPHLCLA